MCSCVSLGYWFKSTSLLLLWQMNFSWGFGRTVYVYFTRSHQNTYLLSCYILSVDGHYQSITMATSMLTWPIQAKILFFLCSNCDTFLSSVSVRRSSSWKHPQSCIFVNWGGSGSWGRWGERGGVWGVVVVSNRLPDSLSNPRPGE